jgi:hypothetical protein
MEMPKVWIDKEFGDIILIGDNLNNDTGSNIELVPILKRRPMISTFTTDIKHIYEMNVGNINYVNNEYQISKGLLMYQYIRYYRCDSNVDTEFYQYMFDESKIYSDVQWLKTINPNNKNYVEINGEMWFIYNIRIPASKDDDYNIRIPSFNNILSVKSLRKIYSGEYIITLLSEACEFDNYNGEIKRKTIEVLAYELEGLKWESSI